MKLYIHLIITVFVLFSCSSKKNASKNNNETQKEYVKDTITYTFENITPKDSLFAHINRTPCFGKCSVYSLKIYNSGLVIYKGNNFVKRLGRYKTVLNKEQMIKFIEKAKSINYMRYDDSYDNKLVTDVPSSTTSIVIDKVRKQVYKRFDYPKEINEFEKLFDDLLELDNWKKIENGKI